MEPLIYTGIGSRKIDEMMECIMIMYGQLLALKNFTLRSGGANGADAAFEAGCDDKDGAKEIYLPWKNFNKNQSPLCHIPIEAYEYAGDIYGPSWQYVKQSTKHFMARNIQQVLGDNLSIPTRFVLCWTPDGCTSRKDRTRTTGGTGQAIACASDLNIPVFNLFNEGCERQFLDFLKETFNIG